MGRTRDGPGPDRPPDRPVDQRVAHEAGLLAEAGRGDERAAALLYDTYAEPLYAYGLRHLADPELAEELVQRVLEKAWRRASTFDPARGPVAAFVFAIARSTVTDLRRAAARQAQPPALRTVEPADDVAEQVLLAASVRAALGRLTADHQRVLELAYSRGLTQQQIAEQLGLPLGTVKSRTYYALRAFRLACEELGVTP